MADKKMNTSKQIFWKDEPESMSAKTPHSFKVLLGIYGVFIKIFFIFIPAYFLALASKYLGIAWLVIIILMYALSFSQKRHRKTAVDNIGEVQRRAKDLVGASQIGSAIHVAGHPLLLREQPVVLALVNDHLNIYAYENSTPLDAIPLKNIQRVYTVAYDDDRIPHIDAIDSAAQAAQLTFLWHEQPCTCLFRRMRKMRPVDWYHTIQQARLQMGLAK